MIEKYGVVHHHVSRLLFKITSFKKTLALLKRSFDKDFPHSVLMSQKRAHTLFTQHLLQLCELNLQA